VGACSADSSPRSFRLLASRVAAPADVDACPIKGVASPATRPPRNPSSGASALRRAGRRPPRLERGRSRGSNVSVGERPLGGGPSSSAVPQQDVFERVPSSPLLARLGTRPLARWADSLGLGPCGLLRRRAGAPASSSLRLRSETSRKTRTTRGSPREARGCGAAAVRSMGVSDHHPLSDQHGWFAGRRLDPCGRTRSTGPGRE